MRCQHADFPNINLAHCRDVAGCASGYPQQVRELEQFGRTIHGGPPSMDASDSERFKTKLSTIQIAANVAMARLSNQAEFVATLAPGSPAHRTASEVLFLLQDSYFLVMKTLEMLVG